MQTINQLCSVLRKTVQCRFLQFRLELSKSLCVPAHAYAYRHTCVCCVLCVCVCVCVFP